jgi:hypothetical protein
MILHDPTGDCRLQCATFSVNHLAFQVLSGRWPKGRRLGPEPVWDGATTRLWPNDGIEIDWPPTYYLSSDQLQSFADRFGRRAHLSRPNVFRRVWTWLCRWLHRILPSKRR